MCYNNVCGVIAQRNYGATEGLEGFEGDQAGGPWQEGRGRRAVAGWLEQERPGEHARVSSFCFY